jgi:hypothetical protein
MNQWQSINRYSRRTNMKSLSAVVIGLALVAGVAGIYRGRSDVDVQLSEANDGAYRDGMYLGRLAAQNGEAPRISVGRWSGDEDRASFAAGYEQGYTATMAARRDAAHATSAAFRDGLFLGSLAVKRGERTQPSTARWATADDRELFVEGYQEAFSNGVSQTATNLPTVTSR